MTTYEIINIILGFLTLIFLAIYVAKTWSMAKSSKESAEQTKLLIQENRIVLDEETAPYIIAFFDVHEHMVDLVLKNIGKSVAMDINISIDPDISKITDADLSTILNKGIKMLVPNQEYRTFLTPTVQMYEKNDKLIFKICLSYKGGFLNKERKYEYTTNLDIYRKRRFTFKKTFDDLVSKIDEIKRAIENLKR